MQNFDGVKPEAFWLLAENRFRNSKEYYEEHKAEINRLVIKPMRQIAAILSEDMLKIDHMANLVPTRMTSRIRRDTRYSKDKRLYRENVWVMFMRPKAQWRSYPCIWFEISPSAYYYGVGIFDQTPALMNVFRKGLREESDTFLEALDQVKKAGAIPSIDSYKRPKNNKVTEEIREYYNAKSFYFIKQGEDLSRLEDESILEELKKAFSFFAPMYKYLLSVADRFTAETAVEASELKEIVVRYNDFDF